MALGLSLVLSLAGLGALCALLFRLATYALPVFAAVAAGLYASNSGAGLLGAITLALVAGVMVLALGQFTFQARALPVRIVVAALFVIPAAVAGYTVVHGLSGFGVASETWRLIFGIFGAAMAGSTALARLIVSNRAVAELPHSSADARSTFEPGEQTGHAHRLASFEPDRNGHRGLSRRRQTGHGHGARRGAIWR